MLTGGETTKTADDPDYHCMMCGGWLTPEQQDKTARTECRRGWGFCPLTNGTRRPGR